MERNDQGIPEDMGMANSSNILFIPGRQPLLALDYKSVFKKVSNFTKGCKWAPDGSSLLVPSEDQNIRVFKLSSTIAHGNFTDEKWLMEGWKEEINPALVIEEKESVYDYSWLPVMNSQDPQSCCFAVTCRDMPVHLWDSTTGQLISSYFAYDHLEQLMAARSISFSPDGQKLVCGYKKALKIFDTSRPGKTSAGVTSEGLTGILSCVAFHPKLRSIFAVGSYTGSIGLYNMNMKTNFAVFEGHFKGVTHIRFSDDGTKLFSGTRKDDEILCWDMRQPGKIFSVLKRDSDTNQRIYFDLTPHDNKYLASGSTNGNVLVWDIKDSLSETSSCDPTEASPLMAFKAHNDCVNGVSFHPSCPILATSSGQRVVKEPQLATNEDSDLDENVKDFVPENTVKLWWLKDIN